MPEVRINIPELRPVARLELDPTNKREVAAALAPTIESLVAAAGITMSADESAELRQAFLERGTITIQPSGANLSSTISVEANSLNYTSRVLQAGRLQALRPQT